MTKQEMWNFIVDRHSQLYRELETKVQGEWEQYCTDFFDYKKLLNEIDSQRHLTIGSGGSVIPDIILRKDDADVFDIELKQYSLTFNTSFETQLISYLVFTHLSVGMIVCNKIYLYHYQYESKTVQKIEIPFEKDNTDGIALMDLLNKGSFSADRIRQYISDKREKEKRIFEIRNTVSSDWLESLVHSELSKKYPEDEISDAISGYHFLVHTEPKAVPTNTVISASLSSPSTARTDVSTSILDWCEMMSNSGNIIFDPSFSSNRYIRFTTDSMDSFIPYKAGCSSGWNNGHFYAYEIDHRAWANVFYMKLAISKKNAPEDILKVFDRIFSITGKFPGKEDWEWKTLFSTKTYTYSKDASEQDIISALNEMYSEIKANIDSLIVALGKI